MKLNKISACLAVISMILNCIPAVSAYENEAVNTPQSQSYTEDQLSGEDEKEYSFTDTSHMSDEEFFGKWDSEAEEWTTVGKLNYASSPDLAEVERLVKFNSYDLAKDALYDYYKNRTGLPQPEFEGSISWPSNVLNMKDAYCFEETPVTLANITNTTDDYEEYTIDIMGVVKHGVFLLSSIDKTTDMVEIASRETELSPSLLVLKEDGSQVTLTPTKDTYIRAGEYQDVVYGDSKKLYVKDSYTNNGDGTYKPFSSESRRTYIAFNANEIPSDATRMYLKIHAKIVPEAGAEVITNNSLEIVVFDAYNQSWDEMQTENNEFSPMTWANYKISHYSWNGLPGGFDYRRPENVPSEWQNYNTRFYNVVSLAKSTLITGNPAYMPKSISDVLDFISDTNGLIASSNMPSGRDFESMARTREAPALIFTYLDSDVFNSQALVAMLKWLWEEMTYLYNGAGCLYQGATDIPQSNNYAQTNRGLWHCEALLTVCAYMPEYADRDMWKELADKRLKSVVDVLINDDGCYQEATFGYPRSVLVDCIDLWNKLEGVGEELPEWYTEKVKLFAKYMMNISFPNHIPPNYGEGDAGSTVSALKNYLDVVEDEAVKYVITDGAEGEEPDYTSAYFEKLQLAACRTGWTPDASMLLMSAKNGGNHNHKDSLHMMFYFDGMDLLADTGMTSYDSGHPHFQWQRHKTRSHNTIEIDGTAQRGSDFLYNDSADENKWNGFAELNLYTSEAVDRIASWTDANEGFRHYRNVSYIKNHDFLIVSDMVKPEDSEEHTYTQNWHTSAKENSNPQIDNLTKKGTTNYYSLPNLMIAQANTENVELTLETGYSVDSPDPTKYFCYTQTGEGAVAYNTVLCPVGVGNTVDVAIEKIDTGTEESIASSMSVNVFKNNEDVLNVFYYNSFEEEPIERSFGRYTSDAANVMIMQDTDEIASFVSMYNGTKVLRDGEEIITSDIKLEDIEVVFDGAQAKITAQDENISEAKLVIAVPRKIKDVTVNGDLVEYVYSDGKIYINNNENIDFSADCGYFVRLSAVNGSNEYPVTVDIPQNSLVSGTLEMPKCMYTDNVFTVTFGNAVLSSCAKITVGGHTDKNVVAVINGAGYSITSKISTGSTQENADAYVSVDAPMLERAREDLVIWTKNVTTFNIGASNESYGNSQGTGTNQGGSGSGGSGGSGGGPSIKNFPVNSQGKVSPVTNPDEEQKGFTFTDCFGHWAEENIRQMYLSGYVNGVSEEVFAPDIEITRAEFAAIAIRILELEQLKYSGVFSDVKADNWFADVVETAYNAGIIQGADGLFRPNDNITREEMAVILMRIYKMNNQAEVEADIRFTDREEISDWAYEAVGAACELKLVEGMDNGSFAPLDNATRAQAVTVFKRLLDILQTVED